MRDLPRPERVVQLCHPDLVNEFPPLRVSKPSVSQYLPIQLTSFVGRQAELTQVQELLSENRLVTLTGAGGVGKTRLAVQIASQLADEFSDGIWYVDLAPITDPELVPITAARIRAARPARPLHTWVCTERGRRFAERSRRFYVSAPTIWPPGGRTLALTSTRSIHARTRPWWTGAILA